MTFQQKVQVVAALATVVFSLLCFWLLLLSAEADTKDKKDAGGEEGRGGPGRKH
jgi:hypothetical protein